MPAARRPTILAHVVGGAAAAALGSIPLHRLPRPVQVCYVAVPAALAGLVIYVGQGPGSGGEPVAPETSEPADSGPEEPSARRAAEPGAAEGAAPVVDEAGEALLEPGGPASERFRIGLALGLGGLTAAAGAAGIWVDRRVEGALRSRGVPVPRLVMGAATGLVSVGLAALDQNEAGEIETGRSRAGG